MPERDPFKGLRQDIPDLLWVLLSPKRQISGYQGEYIYYFTRELKAKQYDMGPSNHLKYQMYFLPFSNMKVYWLSLFIPSINSWSESVHCSVMSDSLRPRGLQHARLPSPSPSPGVCLRSCPLNWWCHPTISSSVVHTLWHVTLQFLSLERNNVFSHLVLIWVDLVTCFSH